MTESMSPRRRWLAALDNAEVDRLPFWPKLDGSYPPARGGRFAGKDNDALHEWIGSDRHKPVGGGPWFREVRTNTSFERRRDGNESREFFHTPGGTLERVQRFDEDSHSWHPVKMPVASLADIRIITEWYADLTIEPDEQAPARAREQAAQIGESAVRTGGIGISPLMVWVEYLAGVENGHYLLADHRDEVEGLFEVMHSQTCRRAELLADNPADMLYMIENTSTTLISPDQFRTYCLRHLRDYAEIVQSNGQRLVLHMCGKLKRLLPDLASLPVAAFEAFTSPKVGDTTLLDGRLACPDVCLIGGTNAALWLEPAEAIIGQLQAHLDALPHHRGLVVTSAGVMPPSAVPEKIRAVCDWVKSYPARMSA